MHDKLIAMMLAASSGGGGGGIGATIYDDEFSFGSVLDTTGLRFPGAQAWTKNNPGTATYTVSGGLLTIVAPATGGPAIDLKMATMPLPAGDGRWQTSLTLVSAAANYQQAGISLVGAAGGVEYIGLQNSSSFGKFIIVERASTPAAGVSIQEASAGVAVTSVILELERISGGTNTVWKYSTNGGGSFTTLYTGQVAGLSPDRIAIYAGGGTATAATATFDWFRKVA